MPVTYGNKVVVTYKEFRESYIGRNPNKIPTMRTTETNRLQLWLYLLCLIAVNILSGGHTVPTIVQFYDFNQYLTYVIGFSGFLAVEGFMFLMMAQPERTKVGLLVIIFSFFAALGSNLYSSFIHFATEGSSWVLWVLAALFGVFAPLANLVAGEFYHSYTIRFKQEKESIKRDYEEEVQKLNATIEKAYLTMLSRIGVDSEEDRNLLIMGLYTEEMSETIETNKPTKASTIQKQWVRDLYTSVEKNGDWELTYPQMVNKYSSLIGSNKINANTWSYMRKLNRGSN